MNLLYTLSLPLAFLLLPLLQTKHLQLKYFCRNELKQLRIHYPSHIHEKFVYEIDIDDQKSVNDLHKKITQQQGLQPTEAKNLLLFKLLYENIFFVLYLYFLNDG